MKDFLNVFFFYFFKQLRSRVFIFITLFLCAVSSIVMIVIPQIFSEDEKPTLYIINQNKYIDYIFNDNKIFTVSADKLTLDFSMLNSKNSIGELEEKSKEEDIDFIYFYGDGHRVKMKVIGDVQLTYINLLYSDIRQIMQDKIIEELGISPSTIQQINPNIDIELANTNEEPESFGIIIVLSLIMVTFIIMYSSSATNEVAYLKTNRVMEMFLTSVKGIPLYIGINLAYAVVPILQVSATFLCVTLVKIFIHKDTSNISNISGINFDILSVKHIIVYVVLLLLGYFIYSLINTALVSIVNKSEDVVAISVPISFIGLIQYFVGLMATTDNTILVKLCSYIPLTSPTVMFIRYVSGFATIIEVLVSIMLLLLTMCILVIIGAKIFTNGITYYGSIKDYKNSGLKLKTKA